MEENEDVNASAYNNAEQKARLLGHVSKEQWVASGKDPDKWRDAEEFLDFGERLNPILRENNRRLEAQLARRDEELKQIREAVQEFAKVHEKTQSEAYAKALADLKREKAELLADGNYDAVVEIDEQIADTKEAARLDKEVAKAKLPPEPNKNEPPVEVQQAYADWLVDNQWANDDVLGTAAVAVGKRLQAKGVPADGVHFRSFLDKVTEEMKKEFPDKFEQKQRNRNSMVEGTNEGSPPPRGSRTYSNLPKDAQESCDFLIRTIPGFTKEKYLAAYKW